MASLNINKFCQKPNEEELICQFCQKYFELPVRLECGNFICRNDLEKCLIDVEENNIFKKMLCKICEQYHFYDMTLDPCFLIDKEKSKSLSQIKNNHKRSEAKKLINEINEKNELEYRESDKLNYIDNYFMKLRGEIMFQKSLFETKAKYLYENLLKSVEDYENKCKTDNSNEFNKIQFNSDKWYDQLRNPNIDDDQLNQIIQDLDRKKYEVNINKNNFEDQILSKACEFVAFDLNLLDENNFLGELKPITANTLSKLKNDSLNESDDTFFSLTKTINDSSSNSEQNEIPDDLVNMNFEDLFNSDSFSNQNLVRKPQDQPNQSKSNLNNKETEFKKISVEKHSIISVHSSPVHTIKHISDDLYASGSQNNELKVWKLSNPSIVFEPESGHDDSVECLAVSNDKRTLISGSFDHTIKLWSLYDQNNNIDIKHVATLEGHFDRVWSLQILNNDLFASGSNDHTIRIWSLIDNKLKHTLRAHTNSVHCLKKSIDGDLISCSEDNTIKIWCFSNNFKCLRTLSGHKKSIYYMDVMPDGNLITGSLDTYIKIWDIKNGVCLKSINTKYQIHCLKYLNYGYLFIGKTGTRKNTKKKRNYKTKFIKILDINKDDYNVVERIEGDAHNVELSSDGFLFTCCSKDNLIKAYKIKFE